MASQPRRNTSPPDASCDSEGSGKGAPGSVTTLVQLLQDQDICRLVLPPREAPRYWIPNDVSSVRRTCKALRDAVDRTVSEVRLKSSHVPGLLQSGLLRRLPALTDVTYVDYGDDTAVSLLEALDSQRLAVYRYSNLSGNTRTQQTPHLFRFLLGRFTQLQKLSFGGCQPLSQGDLEALGRLTALRELSLHTLNSVCTSDALTRLRDLHKLQLVISGSAFIPSWGALLPHLTQLRHVYLSPCSCSTLLLLGTLPHLETAGVEIYVTCALDEALLLAATFPSLWKLDMRVRTYSSPVDGAQLRRVMGRMAPRLRDLSAVFYGNSGAGLAALAELTELTNLQLEVEVDNHPAIDNALLAELSRKTPRLQVFDVILTARVPSRLSDVGFQVAARNWTQLRKFVFYHDESTLTATQLQQQRHRVTLASVVAFLQNPSVKEIKIYEPNLGGQDLEEEVLQLAGRTDCTVDWSWDLED